MEATALPIGINSLSRAPASRWAQNRTAIRYLALILAGFCVAVMIWRLFTKLLWPVAAIEGLVPGSRKPALLLEVALVAGMLTFERPWHFLKTVWRYSTLRYRIMFLAVVSHLLAGVFYTLNYPDHLVDNYCGAVVDARPGLRKIVGHDSVPIEGLAAQCCRELPADARILYHGTQEGWVFAHDVYPRRVFMLPSEGAALFSTWHKSRWLSQLPADPLNDYWTHTVSFSEHQRDEFIKANGITHEVFYDAADSTRCRCEVVR